MNLTRHPKSASGLGNLIVHAERGDSRASARGESDDLRPILVPLEMFAPIVTTRIEEPHQAFRIWVMRPPSITLELVAERATQTKIIKFGCATRRPRDDMVEMKSRQRHCLRSQAILAPVLGDTDDLTAKRRRNARHPVN